MNYRDIIQKLNEEEVKYIICGGVAANIHGLPRMTYDIDFIVSFQDDDFRKFDTIIKSFGYNHRTPTDLVGDIINTDKRQRLILEKNLLAYSYTNNNLPSSLVIDVLIDLPVNFNEIWERKDIKETGGLKINVLSLDDLILLKASANRKQDIKDLEVLKKIKDNGIYRK